MRIHALQTLPALGWTFALALALVFLPACDAAPPSISTSGEGVVVDATDLALQPASGGQWFTP